MLNEYIMTKDEFEQRYAERNNITVEWLHQHNQFGVPCDCGDDTCRGWLMKHIPNVEEQ